MVSHMTKIGEETGDLEGMLTRLADYYDEEVELATQTVMAAIEPMIILVLALIVGVLVAAVMALCLPRIAMDSLCNKEADFECEAQRLLFWCRDIGSRMASFSG